MATVSSVLPKCNLWKKDSTEPLCAVVHVISGCPYLVMWCRNIAWNYIKVFLQVEKKLSWTECNKQQNYQPNLSTVFEKQPSIQKPSSYALGTHSSELRWVIIISKKKKKEIYLLHWKPAGLNSYRHGGVIYHRITAKAKCGAGDSVGLALL